MHNCRVCGNLIEDKNKFCNRICYAKAYELNLIHNTGLFKKGQQSPNKGRSLESWVGEVKGKEIRLKMSENSKKKTPHLRRLNQDKAVLERRIISRKFHDAFVKSTVDEMRERGVKCFILSEYVKEKRIPDAILFDGIELVALEVEQEKVYKPSHSTTIDRLTRINSLPNFFDRTIVIFPSQKEGLEGQVQRLLPDVVDRRNQKG